eukprot:1382256-Rhodomonas_salina.1
MSPSPVHETQVSRSAVAQHGLGPTNRGRTWLKTLQKMPESTAKRLKWFTSLMKLPMLRPSANTSRSADESITVRAA